MLHPQSPGIMDQASVMERSLMKTLRVRSQNRFRMGLGFAFVVGVVAYAFYPEAKKKTSSEFAEVAGGVIQDAEVQKKAETLATAVVHTVLNDPSVLKIATRFVAESWHVILSCNKWLQWRVRRSRNKS